MAALLVALSVMAILMTAAMPVWKQIARREKEEELIFRGQQYARAVGLFQRRAGPGVLAPNVDALIEQHVLRKKYKDPITGEDFDVLRGTVGTAAPGQVQGQPAPGRGAPPGAAAPGGMGAAPPPGGAGTAGGVTGVVSKSKDESIRIYNGKTHYNEWVFIYTPPAQPAGAQAPGAAGQRGGGPQTPGPLGNPGGNTGGRGGFTPGGRGPGPVGPQTPPPFGPQRR